MINKPTIIISSMGRTGTNFFARYCRAIFKNSCSLHEPGAVIFKRQRIRILKNIKYAGWRATIFKKFLNSEDIKHISKKRINGQIDEKIAAEKIINLRKKIIEKCQANLYIEANYQFQGLLDVLPLAFSNFRSIYIIRDPRDWTRSFINRRGLYHWSDIHYLLGNRISAHETKEKTKKEWKKMDQFEKLAWSWAHINEYAINSIKNTAECRLIKFEDIFKSPNKTKNLIDVISFLRQIENCPPLIKNLEEATEEILQTKVNKSYYSIMPKWDKWSKEQAKILDLYCGRLMNKLGYGQEEEWLYLIK
jgi:hypothetical protein